MLMVTNSHAINAGIHKNMRYDPVNDFACVSTVASIPHIVVVHPSVPVTSVKELIALAKRRPGELMAASAGTGSGTHLAFELDAACACAARVPRVATRCRDTRRARSAARARVRAGRRHACRIRGLHEERAGEMDAGHRARNIKPE
jgi:tripartite-type tricarboxylate transporter receptor subunit TctC